MNEMDFRQTPVSVPRRDSLTTASWNQPPVVRTFTEEQLAALREDECLYQDAEAARYAAPGTDADRDEVDDHDDDADGHADEVAQHAAGLVPESAETPEDVRKRRSWFLDSIRGRVRDEGKVQANARREVVAAQDQGCPVQQGQEVRRAAETLTIRGRLATELEPGSSLLARIDQARRLVGTQSSQDNIRREIESDIDRIRKAAMQRAQGRTPSHADYDRALLPEPGGYNDPVLRYCLDQLTDSRRYSAVLRSKAFAEYVQNSDVYDALLGDLVPEDFRRDARSHLKQVAYAGGSNSTALDDWSVFESRLKTRRADPLRDVTTGFRSLDRSLGGGLRGMTFLAGVPGVGKSTLALTFALAALQKHPDLAVLFLSFDMPKDIIYARLLCAEAGVDYLALMDAGLGDGLDGRLNEARERLQNQSLNRLRVIERRSLPREGFTGQWLAAQRRALAAGTNARQVLHVVDHVQHLDIVEEEVNDLQKDERRLRALECVQHSTRTEAHPAGDPMVLISKVRKDSGPTGLGIWDLLGKSDLASGAEAVLCLEPHGDRGGSGGGPVPVVVRVPKGRDGATREPVHLLFEHAVSRFREIEPARERGNKNSPGRRKALNMPGSSPNPVVGKKE